MPVKSSAQRAFSAKCEKVKCQRTGTAILTRREAARPGAPDARERHAERLAAVQEAAGTDATTRMVEDGEAHERVSDGGDHEEVRQPYPLRRSMVARDTTETLDARDRGPTDDAYDHPHASVREDRPVHRP